MLYRFEESGNRRIIESSPMNYIQPERHPTRLLPFHDIFYLESGVWDVIVGNEKITMRSGDLAVVPASIPHYGNSLCTAKTRTLYIHFEAIGGDEPVESAGAGNAGGFVLTSHIHPGDTLIPDLFRHIIRTWRSNLAHRDTRCSALLNLILAELSDFGEQSSIRRDAVILRLQDLITNQPDKFFSIPELAGEAGLSRKALTTRFRAETGQSVHQYQLNLKLDQIAGLIRLDSYTSLKNLAQNYGFCDEFHLSSAFKKKFGVSPANYAKTAFRVE